MSSHYCTMFPKISDLISDQILYKELVNSECLQKDEEDCDDNFYDLNELEEVSLLNTVLPLFFLEIMLSASFSCDLK